MNDFIIAHIMLQFPDYQEYTLANTLFTVFIINKFPPTTHPVWSPEFEL